MPQSIEEQIVANVITTIQGVTTGNGYDNTIGSVQGWRQRGNSVVTLPAAIVRNAGKKQDDEVTALENWTLRLQINVWVDHDEAADARTTDAVLMSLVDDIHRALYVDRTRGGLAIDTKHTDDIAADPAGGQEYAIKILMLAIEFRHREGNPETL